MNNQDKKQPEAYALLYSKQLFAGDALLRELEHYLSEEMPVKRRDDSGVLYFVPPPPWIDITLIFASTTIATSILNKLGEDIYNKLKSSLATLFKKRSEKDTDPFINFMPQTGLSITIMVEGMAVKANIECRDYEEVLEALKATQQIFMDACNKKTTELKTPQKDAGISVEEARLIMRQLGGIRDFRNMPESLALQRTNLLLEYAYDASTKKWSLVGMIP
jgi:hypothetical protein